MGQGGVLPLVHYEFANIYYLNTFGYQLRYKDLFFVNHIKLGIFLKSRAFVRRIFLVKVSINSTLQVIITII